jgi:hypothetical protein
MICALDNKPNVRAEIQNLADKIGADYNTAKIIYENNNGYGLDKAPNGAESKLYKDLLDHYKGDENKALIAKAKTHLKPFFNWFGNWTDPEATNVSKAVDENGEPLVVWHGGSNVDIFDTSGKSSSGAGIKKGDRGTYFTTVKNSAKNYEEMHSYKNFDGMMDTIEEMKYEGYSNEEINEAIKPWESVTRPFYLNVRNPKNTYFSGNRKEGYKSATTNASGNNDGQTITRNDTNEVEWVAFSPNQIKSIDNQGTYSNTDNNVYHNINIDDAFFRLRNAIINSNLSNEVRQHYIKTFNQTYGTSIIGYEKGKKFIISRGVDNYANKVDRIPRSNSEKGLYVKQGVEKLVSHLNSKFNRKLRVHYLSDDKYNEQL